MQVIITRYGGDVNLNHTCLDREAADILISRDDNWGWKKYYQKKWVILAIVYILVQKAIQIKFIDLCLHLRSPP